MEKGVCQGLGSSSGLVWIGFIQWAFFEIENSIYDLRYIRIIMVQKCCKFQLFCDDKMLFYEIYKFVILALENASVALTNNLVCSNSISGNKLTAKHSSNVYVLLPC